MHQSVDDSDDNQSMVTVCANNTDDNILILRPTDPSDYINANNIIYKDEHSTLQTIVEVVNPLLVGDGTANEIAIGRTSDDTSLPTSFDDECDEGVTYRRELSLNDKMKSVLKELKENEKVRLSLSRSMEEDDSENVDGENNVSTSYEEKTGSIGTVFMVRERLINDFYDHENNDNGSDKNIDDCQVFSNPSVDEFLAHEIQHTQSTLDGARKDTLTLDLTAPSAVDRHNIDDNGDGDDNDDDDDAGTTADNTPTTPTKSIAGGLNGGGQKKKRRKSKNKGKK
jgi:hypothetical protein